jgi:hypothetical protein
MFVMFLRLGIFVGVGYSIGEKMFNMFVMFLRFLRLRNFVGVENIQPVR